MTTTVPNPVPSGPPCKNCKMTENECKTLRGQGLGACCGSCEHPKEG